MLEFENQPNQLNAIKFQTVIKSEMAKEVAKGEYFILKLIAKSRKTSSHVTKRK